MDVAYAHRLADPNPIAPYRWEARYAGGGRLRQFDVDGWHSSREIDRARIEALVILGHPASPIVLSRPYADRIPDEVLVSAQTDLVQTLGQGITDRHVVFFFGYRFGAEEFLVRIDAAGRLMRTNGRDG